MIIPTCDAFNGYKLMWIYVMFDLPTETKWQRKCAAIFRKELLRDGFTMHQFSVYIRPCTSYESVDTHVERIRMLVPEEGFVSILKVTDKQFEHTINILGRRAKPPTPQPIQLEFF